jgi:hypothetical protein
MGASGLHGSTEPTPLGEAFMFQGFVLGVEEVVGDVDDALEDVDHAPGKGITAALLQSDSDVAPQYGPE